MLDAFSSEVHYKVYVISKKILYWFHVWDTQKSEQNLECFRKPASHLFKYAHIDPITDFCTLDIPEAIFQAGGSKFSTVGALNTLINIYSGIKC